MWKETLNDLAYAVRRLRLVSISALVYTFYLIQQCLQWIMTSDPASLGEGLAATGVMTTLVALVKFIFEFSAFNEYKDLPKE